VHVTGGAGAQESVPERTTESEVWHVFSGDVGGRKVDQVVVVAAVVSCESAVEVLKGGGSWEA